MNFPTKYSEILERIQEIDPIKYGQTRNHLDGAVTYLSPYISRGVISTKMVLDSVLSKGYPIEEIESFVKELSWRDYFQRLGQVRNLDNEIKFPQSEVENLQIPISVIHAETGIHAIDHAIQDLYANGYMHNHMRMYTAALVTNIQKVKFVVKILIYIKINSLVKVNRVFVIFRIKLESHCEWISNIILGNE